MIIVANWYARVIEEIKGERLPENKDKRSEFLKDFKGRITKNKNLLKIAAEVRAFTKNFPLP